MKYPKLWNGPSPVGEALVRALQQTGSPFLSAATADGVYAGTMDGKSEVKQGRKGSGAYITVPHNNAAPDGWGKPRSEENPYGVPGATPFEALLSRYGRVTPHTGLRAGTVDWVGRNGLRVSFSPENMSGRYLPFAVSTNPWGSPRQPLQWQHIGATPEVYVLGSVTQAPGGVVGAFAQKGFLFAVVREAADEDVLYATRGVIGKARRYRDAPVPGADDIPSVWQEVARVPCPAARFVGVWHFNQSGTQGNIVVHDLDASGNPDPERYAYEKNTHIVRLSVAVGDDGPSATYDTELLEGTGLRVTFTNEPNPDIVESSVWLTHAVTQIDWGGTVVTDTRDGDQSAAFEAEAQALFESLASGAQVKEYMTPQNAGNFSVAVPGFVGGFGASWGARAWFVAPPAGAPDVYVTVIHAHSVQEESVQTSGGVRGYVCTVSGTDIVAVDYRGDDEVEVTLSGNGEFLFSSNLPIGRTARVSWLAPQIGSPPVPPWYDGPPAPGLSPASGYASAFAVTYSRSNFSLGFQVSGGYTVSLSAGGVSFDVIAGAGSEFGVGYNTTQSYEVSGAYGGASDSETVEDMVSGPGELIVRQVVGLDARYDHALTKEMSYAFTLAPGVVAVPTAPTTANIRDRATSPCAIRYIAHAPHESVLSTAVGDSYTQGVQYSVGARTSIEHLLAPIACPNSRFANYYCDVWKAAVFGEVPLSGADAWDSARATETRMFFGSGGTPLFTAYSGNWMAGRRRGDALISISDKHTQGTWLFANSELVDTAAKFAARLDSETFRFNMAPVAAL